MIDGNGDEGEPAITEDGFDRLMSDLGVAEDDLVQFLLPWECSCKKVSVITLNEFRVGMSRLEYVLISWRNRKSLFLIFHNRGDSIAKIKDKLPALRKKIDNPKEFKDFYFWFFGYAKASAEKKGLRKR